MPEKKINILKMCAKSKQRVVNDERNITFHAAINTQAKNIDLQSASIQDLSFPEYCEIQCPEEICVFCRALVLSEIVQTSSRTKQIFSNVAKDQINTLYGQVMTKIESAAGVCPILQHLKNPVEYLFQVPIK